jgi:hypothetical protein
LIDYLTVQSLISLFHGASAPIKLSVLRSRIIETLCLCKNDDIFRIYSESIIFQQLVDWVKSRDDILMCITGIDLCLIVCEISSGVQFLQNRGVVGVLKNIIFTDDEYDFLIPHAISFFGKLASLHSEVFFKLDSESSMLKRFTQLAEHSRDQTVEESAITAIGRICSSNSGIITAHARCNNIWKTLAHVLGSSNNQLRVPINRALAVIFSSASDKQAIELVEKLYEQLHLSNVSFLKGFQTDSRNTFPDMKFSGYAALRGISRQKFGAKVLFIQSAIIKLCRT